MSPRRGWMLFAAHAIGALLLAWPRTAVAVGGADVGAQLVEPA